MTVTEHRPAATYVGMPMEVTLERLPHEVGEAFHQVATLLAAHGVAPRGAVIRYVAARADGTFAIEVGHLVDPADLAGTPIAADELPAGEYSVARHTGPYSRLGEVTRALMASWGQDGVEPAAARTATGEDYASWYEHYLDMPVPGPEGPEGTVEVCVLTA